jgi:phosphatidylglycerophosphatase A
MNRATALIATLGGLGHIRFAPGTWGSLAALPVTWALHVAGGFPLVVAALVLVTLLGGWATSVYVASAVDDDPGEVIIDEVAGQMLALLPLSYPAWSMGIEITRLWPGWIAAFVLFRLFDIWKPGPVGWADRMPGARGVMLDDLIAGALAAIGVIVLAGLWHGVMGQ